MSSAFYIGLTLQWWYQSNSGLVGQRLGWGKWVLVLGTTFKGTPKHSVIKANDILKIKIYAEICKKYKKYKNLNKDQCPDKLHGCLMKEISVFKYFETTLTFWKKINH